MKVILRTLCGCEKLMDVGAKTWGTLPRSIAVPIMARIGWKELDFSKEPEPDSHFKRRSFKLVHMSDNCFQHPLYIEEWE